MEASLADAVLERAEAFELWGGGVWVLGATEEEGNRVTGSVWIVESGMAEFEVEDTCPLGQDRFNPRVAFEQEWVAVDFVELW